MQLSGAFPITFSNGGNDYILKYACDTCHVEMNRTEKAPFQPGAEHGSLVVDAPPTADRFGTDVSPAVEVETRSRELV